MSSACKSLMEVPQSDSPPAKLRRVEVQEENVGECGDEEFGIVLTLRQLLKLEPQLWMNAEIKALHSDFVVREVLSSGSPLRVGSLVDSSTRVEAEGITPHQSGGVDEGVLREAFATLITDKSLEELIRAVNLNDPVLQREVSLHPRSECKEVRTAIHQAIRNYLGNRWISTTVDGAVVVSSANRAQRHEQARRSRAGSATPYLHFTLMKVNIDTASALRFVAKVARVSASSLEYCGVKDKRAVTVQRIACRGLSIGALRAVNERTPARNAFVRISDAEAAAQGFSLGDNVGNAFEVAFRTFDAPPSVETATAWESQLVRHGFVNYFGPQRFGTTAIRTYDVGVRILRGEHLEAVGLLLRSRATLSPDSAPAVKAFEEGDYARAVLCMPHYCPMERDVLRHLEARPRDIQGALLTLPRTVLMMYPHSVQSRAWNVAVSARLAAHCGVIKGDVVMRDGTPALVTAEDIENGVYSLSEIVVPLPSSDEDTVYPTSQGCTREAFLELLQRWGASALMEPNAPMANALHLHSTYRPVIVRPTCVSLQTLEGNSVESRQGEITSLEVDWRTSSALPTTPPPAAMVARFQLPSGSYATCAMREFCHVRTT